MTVKEMKELLENFSDDTVLMVKGDYEDKEVYHVFETFENENIVIIETR